MKRRIDIIIEAMEHEDRPLNGFEISDLTGLGVKGVQEGIAVFRQQANKAGVNSGIYIAHFAKRLEGVKGYESAYYALGDKPDAIRPSRKGQPLYIIDDADAQWRAKEMRKHEIKMCKLLPVLARVRGNPFGSLAIQLGAM